VAGTITVANTGGGVLVNGAQQTTLSGNTISGNTGFGVRLSATKTVTATGNFIGFDTARTGTVANTGPGIDVQDASTNTLIGGNFLAGNGGAAISLAGTQTVSSTISTNIIGLVKNAAADTLYLKALGNTGDGVLVSGGPQRTTVTANTIGGNTGTGVKIVGSTTLTTTISANNIGWVVAADSTRVSRPNSIGGIAISAAKFVDVRTNDVRFNVGDAIAATDALTVTMASNTLIGQTGSGNGVLVAGASRNVQVLSNTIGLNVGQATLVQGTAQRVRIQYNRMTGNGGGVVLTGTSLYPGSGADADTATLPNHGIDPPIYDLANAKPLRLRLNQNGFVSGWVYTDTNRVSSCVPVTACRIQFFRSNDGVIDGQGFIPLTITPDGGTASDFATPNAAGFFSGQLSNILPLPDQLIFAATDGNGNTSAFGMLTVAPSLSMGYLNPVGGQQNAAPGQTVTYTLSLVNSGNIDFTNLNFTTGRTRAHWVVNPLNRSTNLLNLPASSTKTITVALTLPNGTDVNARAGLQDTTLVTSTVNDQVKDLLIRSRLITTTVLATPVVSASTITGAGSAPPGGQVTHTHRFTNTGNVTVTLDLAQHTVDPADSGFIWATTLSQNQLVIGPGGSADVTVTVAVPAGAQVVDALGNPIRVTTYVTATAQAPFNSIVRVVSGTTGVDLVPGVQISGNGQSDQAASNAEISFFHSITNTSNGPARFCLNYRSNSGSQVVSFISQNTVAITVAAQGSCFTLDTLNNALSGKSTILRFKALIKVTGKLLPGDTDSISLYLTSLDTGKELANGSVIDKVLITSSPVLPRIWLPLILN
jgi:parallel beta-helix repeat protein